MLTEDFYNILDRELDEIIKENKGDEILKKHKDNIENRKSYAFLIWFLKHYGQKGSNYKEFITDGDDDSYCDIIFDQYDLTNKKIFYVVQSKWCIFKNINKSSGTTADINASLNSFDLLLSGKKKDSKVNVKFNEKYSELKEHLKKNGEVKFIFLTLSLGLHKAEENEKHFKSKTKLIDFNIIDILKLKKDYIDIKYKGFIKENPLEKEFIPKGPIKIQFEVGQFIKVSYPNPYPSYVFLVRPKTIYELYNTFRYSLFQENIRNPLVKAKTKKNNDIESESDFNKQIEYTAKNEPKNFWYFNNGITAITSGGFIDKDLYDNSSIIQLRGIQIINGAQTVYSIYRAYRDADNQTKESMDSFALITFRILESGGKDFDLKVTRYTNSQNPVDDRDFYSNDETQVRLQNEFFENTNIWYEKRRGEFVELPSSKEANIVKVSNINLGKAYMAFHLQEPHKAINNTKYIFIRASTDPKDGLYDFVFNSNTNYADMLTAFYILEYIESRRKQYDKKRKNIKVNKDGKYNKNDTELLELSFILFSDYYILSLFKLFLLKKYSSIREINNRIKKDYTENQYKITAETYEDIIKKLNKFFSLKRKRDSNFNVERFLKLQNSYIELKSVAE